MSRRKGSLSLRGRVIAGFAIVAAIAVAIAVTVTVTTHNYQVSQLDDRLGSFAGPVQFEQPVQQLPGGGPRERDELSRPSDVVRGYLQDDGTLHVFFAPNVEGATDAVPVVDPSTLSEGESTYLTVPASDGDGEFRVLARPVADGWDVTALSMDGVQSATNRLVTIQAVGIVLTLGTLALVAWWVIRLGVVPMRRMVDASQQIADGDLSVRLEGASAGSESADLADALNTMIGTLTSSLEERERSEARLREFVADASHELRTPLTTVLGYSELHRRGALAGDAAQDDAWARTESEAARMKRLVDDMLELAKYDAEPSLAMTPVALGALATEVVTNAATAHGEITFEASGDATVNGDPDKLRQALINVVTNAAVHGGTHVEVTVASATREHGDPVATVTVTDNGPGMEPEVAARATERFVRGDSSRHRATGGAGLGLAITAAIVEAHGGRLDVASTAGEGATVTLSFPLESVRGLERHGD